MPSLLPCRMPAWLRRRRGQEGQSSDRVGDCRRHTGLAISARVRPAASPTWRFMRETVELDDDEAGLVGADDVRPTASSEGAHQGAVVRNRPRRARRAGDRPAMPPPQHGSAAGRCVIGANSEGLLPHRCLVGVTVLTGTASDIENVSQVFQPDGRLAAANSPYPFSRKTPDCLRSGKYIQPADRYRKPGSGSRREWPVLSKIVRDLLIGVADETDEDLLRQELRRSQSKWKSTPLRYCVSGFLKL